VTGETVLVAVDDSAAGFAAARQAIALTAALHGRLVAVTVVAATGPPAHPPGAGPLRVVAGLARACGVPVELRTVRGRVPDQLLGQVREVSAAYLVVGRAHRPGAGLPHLGRTAEQVLEFSDVPVVVVPVSAPELPCGLPVSGCGQREDAGGRHG
jgi:nucleotide-binding universal stress UspA family protein